MDLNFNRAKPHIMHIDLNSCFATIEQQANPLLRGKPIVVAAYETPNAFILAPSIEAKAMGVKMGMRIRDARLVCPNLVVRMPDPPKYRDVHVKFRRIFSDYSDDVTPKSIDEAVIDFSGMENLNLDLVGIAREIKKRMREEIGEWIVCSVGISTNMFLAKLAASLHKPDGLDVIDYKNIIDVYKRVTLLDLNGINVRYQARLNINGIYTPMDFLDASSRTLEKGVFKSVVGSYWYNKLRGYESDQKYFKTKSIGQQYALRIPTSDSVEISRILMKLCEKMGRRLRRKGLSAYGVHVFCQYRDHTSWHMGKKSKSQMYSTLSLYRRVQAILSNQPYIKDITNIGVSCYALSASDHRQMMLFDADDTRDKRVSDALDNINDKYGEFTITPALMMEMNNKVLDRIAFGGIRDLENLYETAS